MKTYVSIGPYGYPTWMIAEKSERKILDVLEMKTKMSQAKMEKLLI